ncbi:MAG TPA: hypothetical protein VGH33_25110 [Isosphaeraceae bacterium]|jgi:hypothetical protein
MAAKSNKNKPSAAEKNTPAEGRPAEEARTPPRARDAKGRFIKTDRPAEQDRADEAPRILPQLASPKAFTDWLSRQIGIDVKLPTTAVCPGHTSPWDIFLAIFKDRPQLALVHGGRGTGKTYLSALDTHLTSLKCPGHGTRVLGGSLAQSEQIYRALREFVGLWPEDKDPKPIKSLRKGEAVYKNGSEVAVLAASSTSVRGPHVPSLKLDEVDEIPEEHFEAAMGMCMNRRKGRGSRKGSNSRASIVMTSTCHRRGGLMSRLIEQGEAGEFPLYTMCIFEVLEKCSPKRSGKHLEKCPDCPLVKYCHDVPEGATPKAKRSDGHYSIDALIQKLRAVSTRTFESDYLCRAPKAEGVWFPTFSAEANVSERAEYDPALPVHVAIDSGVTTGAVFFQVTPDHRGDGSSEYVHVFADYVREGGTAEANGQAILDVARILCKGRIDRVSTDPAGGARNPVGPTVIAEYERAGLRPLERWPIGPVADGLSLIESFVQPAEGPSRLLVHPRCKATIQAFQSYRRAKRGGQWQDYPEDPQHPHEDLLDPLRGGLRLLYPEGRARPPALRRIAARKVM